MAAAALCGLAFAGCRKSRESSAPRAEAAAEFALRDLSGRTVRLSDFRGKVVLLDFWATWCGPCEATIPFLEAIYEKRRAEGLEVVGISVDSFPADVPSYVRDHKMEYRVLVDPERKAMDLYGVHGVPTSVLVDREGNIAAQWDGINEDIPGEIRAAVDGLLAAKKA